MKRSAMSLGEVHFKRAYSGSTASIMECGVKGCANYTMEMREGKPMCERCMEEIDALDRMYQAEHFEKEFKSRVEDWRRRHVQLKPKGWTKVDRALMAFVACALLYLGWIYAPSVLEWFGIGVR